MVDNGSTDGSVDRWDERHPDVTLIQTGANLGYAGGVNRGLADLERRRRGRAGELRRLRRAGLAASAGRRPRRRRCARCRLAQDPLRRPGRRRARRGSTTWATSWATTGRHATAATARSTPASTTTRRTCGAGAARPCCSAAATSTTSAASTSGSSCTPRTPTSAGAAPGGGGGTATCRPPSCTTSTGPAPAGSARPRLDHLNRRNRLVVVTRHAGLRGAATAWARRSAGSSWRSGPTCSLPCSGVSRPDVAPWCRRVRAAVDAARLLVGGHPGLPY